MALVGRKTQDMHFKLVKISKFTYKDTVLDIVSNLQITQRLPIPAPVWFRYENPCAGCGQRIVSVALFIVSS